MQTLTNLWTIFKSIVSAIGRLLYLLLIRLFLIIPTLYVVAVWIASLCVPFSLSDYSLFLIIGTVLCMALSALLVLRRAMVAPVTKKKTPRTSIVTRELDTRPEDEDFRPREERTGARRSERKEPDFDPPQEEPPPASARYPLPPANEPVYPRYRGPETPDYFEKEETAPKYYRSRKDPTLYVAEFAEYMEFYRKTADGRFVFLAREDKE